jgi:hypothetical protein
MVWNIVSATTVELAAGVRLSTQTIAFASGQTGIGIGSALLGANCPAGILAAPVTWLRVVCPDGGVGYIPVWR